MSKLSAYLSQQKRVFLDAKQKKGGKAPDFRKLIGQKYTEDPKLFDSMVLDALMEAATKSWEAPPRKSGPDLFAINGYTIPEFLTRPAASYAAEEGEDEELAFEKVSQKFAIVQDLGDDATIKMRKAAQSSAAAEEEMRSFDEARRRARGNLTARLIDLADEGRAQAA